MSLCSECKSKLNDKFIAIDYDCLIIAGILGIRILPTYLL